MQPLSSEKPITRHLERSLIIDHVPTFTTGTPLTATALGPRGELPRRARAASRVTAEQGALHEG